MSEQLDSLLVLAKANQADPGTVLVAAGRSYEDDRLIAVARDGSAWINGQAGGAADLPQEDAWFVLDFGAALSPAAPELAKETAALSPACAKSLQEFIGAALALDPQACLLDALEKHKRLLSVAWSAQTSADASWSPLNPAAGQCAVSALAIQDAFGGEIVWTEAALPGQERVSHYLNRFAAFDFDATCEQFPEGAAFARPAPKPGEFASTRERILSFDATRGRYALLLANLREAPCAPAPKGKAKP